MYAMNRRNFMMVEMDNNTNTGRFSQTELSLHGIFTQEICLNNECKLEAERCLNPTGTACDNATSHRCKSMKAFSIIGIITGN